MATTQPEAKITKKIITHINGLDRALAHKVHQGRFGGGEPDIDACVDGRSVKLEVKVPGNKPTPLQMVTMRRWEAAGALAGWCTSVETAEEILQHVKEPGWSNPQLMV